MKNRPIFNGLKTVLAVILLGGAVMANSIEEPQHEVVGRLGKIEIRYYQPSIQAVTTLNSSNQTSNGFQRLAGYIFGGNDGAEKIAMTAPVAETITRGKPEMAFTMPAQYQLDDLPIPNDARISLKEVPARHVAVVSFSGWATPSKVRRYTKRLLAELESSQTETLGMPLLNQYNPPWTLPFLRRNEIVVEIEQPVEASFVDMQARSGLTYSF